MFTFSHQWLQKLNRAPIPLAELLDILNLQGLEVKKVSSVNNDTLVMIEVKANRSFCLSYLGVLREYRAYKKMPQLNYFEHLKTLNFSKKIMDLSVRVDTKLCSRFSGVILRHLKNQPSSQEIIDVLHASGISAVNAVVDSLNLIMLETGQPLHAYDLKKVKDFLLVKVNPYKKHTITTLNNTENQIPQNAIIIKDKDKTLAVAGVIGAKDCAVTEETTDIFIECAVFKPAAVRVASREMKVLTPSAFRFERGVDSAQIPDVLAKCVSVIQETCGGRLGEALDIDHAKARKNIFYVSPKNITKLLGLDISETEIIDCLSQYYFHCQKERGKIKVIVPSFRQDIKSDVELIGEVARIYGYHQVTPTLPKLPIQARPNKLWQMSEKIRDYFVSLGFFEVMTYSFIPLESRRQLGLQIEDALYGDAVLGNPLSNDYALMRPSLVYSLMQCMAYNYSIGNKNFGIFEIGRTYKKASQHETGYAETDVVGAIFSGNRIERGFGLVKDIAYRYDDLLNYLQIIFSELGMNYELSACAFPFLVSGSSFQIKHQEKIIGFLGQINPANWLQLSNGKLITEPAFYLELNLTQLETKPKTIQYKSVFPPIIREYNFKVAKQQKIATILSTINKTDSLIQDAKLKDIYEGKGVPPDQKFVLIEVKYATPTRTLTATEITAIEARFLDALQKINVSLSL